MSTDAAGNQSSTPPSRPPQDLEIERVAAGAVAREQRMQRASSAMGDPSTASHASSHGEPASAREQLVELLNADLRTEFQSIVQYVQHVATLKGAEYTSTIAELKAHLSQELAHALILAEQVDFLGGTPSVTVPDVPSTNDTVSALRLDLALESDQLVRYRDRVQQATEWGLPDVAEALRPLLEQTQEHVRDLRTALGE